MDTKCRHCNPFPLKDTYASILVANGEAHLLNTLDSLEQRLIPCVTAVCPQCEQEKVVNPIPPKRLISKSNFALKGGGWADTGYKK